VAETKADKSWMGPVLGALILIGGYVAYQEWNKGNAHEEMCAALKRRFQANMTDMMGSGAIERSIKAGNQSPMASIAADVASNKQVMKTLDTECPGWIEKQYYRLSDDHSDRVGSDRSNVLPSKADRSLDEAGKALDEADPNNPDSLIAAGEALERAANEVEKAAN
jgi:hypothetical protein